MFDSRRLLLAATAALMVAVTVIAPSATARLQSFKPVIGKAVTVPARPLAGKSFTVSFKVIRSDTRTPLLKGKMICDPSIAGAVIRHAESFKAGTARLAFVVPSTAQGKLLKVRLTIRATGGSSATRVETFLVQRGVTVTPSLAISDASVAEGNAGTTTLSFPVALSAASTQSVSVDYATADGTATGPGDYAASKGTLTFKPGETTKQISVSVVGDTAIEATETFTVTLSNAVNATIATGVATGTITNDDTSVPITAGSYKGLIDGNFLFFDVLPDRTLTGMRFNYFREDCNGGGYIYGSLEMGARRLPIGADGTFKFTRNESGKVSGAPATFYFEIGGRFEGVNATGTVLATSQFDYQGTHYNCSSGTKTWTATRQS